MLQAVWDSVIGFFEDAIVASCSRPGKLVITPVSHDTHFPLAYTGVREI